MFRRDNIFLSILAALIVTPASFMMALFWLTNDPTLRPLGITQEKLASAGMSEERGAITTTVRMGENASLPMTRGEFEDAINKAFDLYGLESRFRYETVKGMAGVQISYSVGKSNVGIYSLRSAAQGIRPTAEAYQMVVKHNMRVAASNRARLGVIERIFAE